MSDPQASRGAGTALPLLGRRRSFLLRRRFQIRIAVWACAIALLLLVPLNLTLHWVAAAGTERIGAEAPELADALRARDRAQAVLVLGASVVFLAGVFALGVLESHRTAGAAMRIERTLDAMAGGRLDARVVLRRGDSLGELAAAVNRLGAALEDRARDDGTGARSAPR